MAIKEIPKNTRFERLVTTGEVEVRGEGSKKFAYFECRCDCGNVIWTRGTNLRYGTTKSCGCYKRDAINKSIQKHFSSKTKLYNTWLAMKRRCYNSNSESYYLYGERGIKVCEEWLGENGFINFKIWALSNGYQENLTIDRIDVNGNYEPNNCRWVDMNVQNRNKRNNRVFYYHGKRKILKDLAIENGISVSGLRKRLNKGMSIEEAIETPIKNIRKEVEVCQVK